MTDPILMLEREWRRGSAGALLAQRLREWGESEPALRRFDSPGALFGFLRSSPSAERDAVFCALLSRARTEPLAGMVLLEALLPGLKAITAALLIDARRREELWSVLLAHIWEQIRTYPVERRPRRVAANLLLDARKAVVKELGHNPDRPDAPHHTLPAECEAPAQGNSDLNGLFLRAISARAVTREEAALILWTRIDGWSLADVARELGLPYMTTYMRRERAERRLLLFLGYRAEVNAASPARASHAVAVNRRRGAIRPRQADG